MVYCQEKGMTMLTSISGFIAVISAAIVVFAVTTSGGVGIFEVLMIAIFGIIAIGATIIFAVMIMGRYGVGKVKKGVVKFKTRRLNK